MRTTKIVLGILAIALVPVLLQALFGYGGQGFTMHLPSWLELKTLWGLHEWRAGWASEANFGLGDPRFTYYPPVSFVLGAGLGVVLPVRILPAIYTWIVFALSGLGMLFASRDYIAREDRWKTALLYMLSPYLLTAMLVRFSAAEALTLAWLPVTLGYFHRAVWRNERRAVMLLGCLLGLTWITDIPASIVLLFVLSTSVFVLAFVRGSVKPLPTILLAEVIAGALAAFYLVPTWIERAWIHGETLHAEAGLPDRGDLLFLFTRPRHASISLFAIGLWIISLTGLLLAILYARRGWKSSENRQTTRTWLVLAAVSLFFELPLAFGLWQHLPALRLADFPYRFLAPMGAALPLMLFAESTPRRWRTIGCIVLGLLAVIPIWEYGAAKGGFTNLRVLAPVWQNMGYRGWQEFVPAGAVAPLKAPQIEPVSVADPAQYPHCSASLESEQDDLAASGEKTILIDSPTLCKVRIGQFFFPYWRAIDDSGIPLPISQDTDGLLLVSVPAGRHTVKLKFVVTSPARSASWITSGLSLALV
ncbi:MAG TPA: 6-pyruvoyl-tetrahydropterin synthase-related protein, partial [Acidobacteriaceae bacterium]|nr:6-pyruvoyl-tetrahydropterin synthase-related protein [Acidobacteriaceae bacterium]